MLAIGQTECQVSVWIPPFNPPNNSGLQIKESVVRLSMPRVTSLGFQPRSACLQNPASLACTLCTGTQVSNIREDISSTGSTSSEL